MSLSKFPFAYLYILITLLSTSHLKAEDVDSTSSNRDIVNYFEVGQSLSRFRKEVISDQSPDLGASLIDMITARSPHSAKLPQAYSKKLGVEFFSGAIPISLGDHIGAFYNPFCDLFLIVDLKKDDPTRLFHIKSGFISGGDALASLNGGIEAYFDPNGLHLVKMGIADRFKNRYKLLQENFKNTPYEEMAEKLSSETIQPSLIMRYLSLDTGIANFSPLEINLYKTISKSLMKGDFSNLSKIDENIIIPLRSSLLDLKMERKIACQIVFAIGPPNNRATYIEPVENPLEILAIKTSYNNGKLKLGDAVIINMGNIIK